MRQQSPVRLLACLAVAASSVLGAMIPGGLAVGATTEQVTCRSFSFHKVHITKGPQIGDLSRCSGSGASLTGVSGVEEFTGPYATVDWKSGRTSVLSSPKVVFVANDCPKLNGKKALLKGVVSGTVKGGSARGLIGNKYKMTTCSYGSGAEAGFGPQYF